ncbi:MAG: hypothetical protein J4F44_03490 [Acidimicrobiia bacterium]|nr:hypothetical protein [Acidimicrobiia bacterium]
MSSVYVRYLLPALVVAACAVLALVGRRRRGHRRAVEEHSSRIVEATLPPDPTDPASEQAWQRLHGAVLDDWITAHENLLDRASADDFSEARAALDLSDEVASEQLDIAVAAHPNPRRRAELSALRAAARSTLVALAQGDYERARQHHLVYCDYRDLWREHAATEPGAGDP